MTITALEKVSPPSSEVTILSHAFGPDGSAYFVVMGSDLKGKGNLPLYGSKDSGKTWALLTKLPGLDREYIVVDNTGGKYNGRIYIHGTGGVKTFDKDRRYSGMTIFRSIDGGESFEQLVKLASSDNHYVLGMGNSVVLSDGTLMILFGELRKYGSENSSGVPEAKPSRPNAWLKIVTSDDGGETFSKAVIVNDFYLPWNWSSSAIPYLATDQSSGHFKDRLYAVWPDLRSGRLEILFAYSSDKGKTWSKPIFVNDDRPPADPAKGPNHFMPVVAVNRDGVVGVMWYDRRENPDNIGWWIRFAASLDGGETFLPSVKVSEAPFSHGQDDKKVIWALGSGGGNPKKWARGGPLKVELGIHGFYFNGGHTAGMAASTDGVFYPFWVDNRTGISQLWTAPVRVEGKAIRNGSTELSNLEDISEKVTIEYTNNYYNPENNTLLVDAQLTNTSKEILIGPIKARVILLKSDIGIPEVLNADNKESGVGAVWDFTPLLKDNKLMPEERLKVKPLKFRLSDLRPIRPSKHYIIRFVSIQARVLGKVEKEKKKETQ